MSGKFKNDLKVAIGDKIKDNDICKQIWCALANVDWVHKETGEIASYTFRGAGYLIADLRGEGDYLDWYCCGNDSTVSDFIRRSLKKKGWIADDIPEICDVNNCLGFVSAGWPSADGYRITCSEHYHNKANKEGVIPCPANEPIT